MTDELEARIASLKSKGDDHAEEATKPREETINWNKGVKEGDMIAGLMVRGAKVQKPGWDGSRYLMEVRDHATGDLYVVWCGNYMLNRAIIDVAPAEGALVVVQFHGKEQSQKDPTRSFNVFTLETERSDFEYWHQIDLKFIRDQETKPSGPGGGSVAVPQFGPDDAPF